MLSSIPDDPVWINGDFTLLYRAVLNLLTNAIKFSPEQAQVTLALAIHPTELLISITNQGPGIPLEEQDKLFQRFSHSSPQSQGAGLGLYFVRTVAEKHGGDVGVESSQDGPTRFTIHLPYHPHQDEYVSNQF